MEPEDLPWPEELEEEEEEEEEEGEEEEGKKEVENASAAATEEALTSEESGRLEEFEEAGPDLDFNYESQRQESSDEEEDELAKAWLQAHPDRPGSAFSLPPPTPPPPPPPLSPRLRYTPVEHLGKTEVRSGSVARSWAVGRSGAEAKRL